MSRTPFNVLVLPYRHVAYHLEYAVFCRPEASMWQFIAGGGEGDEAPLATARRETLEEAGLQRDADHWMALDACASIPRTAFPGAPWPADVLVIPEICFAVDAGEADIHISDEHERFDWLDYEAACERLTWDSNRVALWELRERLRSSACRSLSSSVRPGPIRPSGPDSGSG